MIELANVLSKNIWLSIPSVASSNCIQQMAIYVKANLLNKTAIIYLEQSSNKQFSQSNRTLELNLMTNWNLVNDTRVKHVLATQFRAFFNNPAQYNVADYALFDYFAVSGQIASNLPYMSNTFDVSVTVNYTTQTILDAIRQQIYADEIDLIYMMQIAAVRVQKPLLVYDVGFKG